MITVRKAEIRDLRAIVEIYNQAVLHTTATFDTAAKTVEEQRVWFDHHGPKFPILVAEEDKQVLGWASVSEYSDRCAYSGTAEASIYITEARQHQGLGRQLSEAILKAAKEAKLHTVILKIASENDASIKLAKSLGFKTIGVMQEVGKKFGRMLDVTIMQIIFS